MPNETETHTFYQKGSSVPIRTDTVETKISPADEHRVYEGVKPLDLKPGDLVLKVDKRPDGSLCCLTVYRRAE